MPGMRHLREQRREPRRQVNALRLNWRDGREETVRTGWISDMAMAGIGFVTPTRNRPTPGEMLELTIAPTSPSPRACTVRIVHTSPYDGLFTLVGCRTETAIEMAPPAT